jgi:hypothetical protein
MRSPDLPGLVQKVRDVLEIDLGATWTRLDRDPEGVQVLAIWWARGCRHLTVRLYPGRTTVEVSALRKGGRCRVGLEVLIAGDLDFFRVLRRGVDWLRADAHPFDFDPGSEAARIVPDFKEAP